MCNDGTYKRTKLVRDTKIRYDTQSSLMNDSLWTEDFTVTPFGKCHSLQIKLPNGAEFTKNQMFFHLDKGQNFDIFVHDENYFNINENSKGISSLYIYNHVHSRHVLSR